MSIFPLLRENRNMPRTNLWLVLIVIASMLGVWYFGSDRGQSRSEAAIPPVTIEGNDLPEVPPAPSPRNDVRRTQLQSELETLQKELSQKAQTLDEKKKALDRLQRQKASVAGGASYRSQIETRDLAIQSLVDDLGNYRQAEGDLNQSATLALKNQDSQAALARAEVDARIQDLEQGIRNTENDLNYWQKYPVGQEVLNQAREVERLQNELSQQKLQLNALRSQRVGISAEVLNGSRTIQSLAEQARSELRNSMAVTQERIYTLRDEMDRLQQAQAGAQGTLQGLNLQISRMEKDLEDQSRELQRLQESVREKQSEIQAQ